MTVWLLVLITAGKLYSSGVAFDTEESCRIAGETVLHGFRWVCVEVLRDNNSAEGTYLRQPVG